MLFNPKEVYLLVALYILPPFPPTTKHKITKILYQRCSETNSFGSCKNFVNKLLELNILQLNNMSETKKKSKTVIVYGLDREVFSTVWKRTPYFHLSLEIIIFELNQLGIMYWNENKIRKLLFQDVRNVST